MKIQNKLFIFGHCRNTLRRLTPHLTKDIRFLDCTRRTDSGESRKPCEALYSNRQSGNVFDNSTISSKRIAHAHIRSEVWASALKTVRSPSRVVVNRPYWLGMDNTNKQGGATSFLKLSDTTSDRLRSLNRGLLLNGGRGQTSFLSLLNFVPSCG